jgi:hypothetical protein
MNDYPLLGSPLKLGPKTARNRIWMTAHATLLVKDHLFTDQHIAYYTARAKGGLPSSRWRRWLLIQRRNPTRAKRLHSIRE